MPWAKDNKKSWKSDRAMLDAILAKFGKKRMSQISSFEVEKYKIERRDSLTVREKPRSRSSVNKELKPPGCAYVRRDSRGGSSAHSP